MTAAEHVPDGQTTGVLIPAGRGRGKDSRYIRFPAALLEQAKVCGIDVAAVCVVAIETATDAVRSGEAQTLTLGLKVTKTLDVQRS